MAKIKATYVSIWDGNNFIQTNCEFDTETKNVTNIESADDDGDLDILFDEYVVLSNGEEVRDYTIEGEDVER